MNGGLIIPNKDTARALNDLARHKAIVRILSDIRMDMEICEIEGWDKREYINELKSLLNSIGGQPMIAIKDLTRLPTNCSSCDFLHHRMNGTYVCSVSKQPNHTRELVTLHGSDRPGWCPLVVIEDYEYEFVKDAFASLDELLLHGAKRE